MMLKRGRPEHHHRQHGPASTSPVAQGRLFVRAESTLYAFGQE